MERVEKISPGTRALASLLLPLMVLATITLGMATIPSTVQAEPPLFRTSGGWAIETVDSANDVGYFPSIAIDSDDKVHISYADETDPLYAKLKYATNSEGRWSATVVDDVGDVGDYTSIAIDSNDKVHISYQDTTNAALKYATNAGGSWAFTTLTSASGSLGGFTSIALDSNDKVHISFYNYTGRDLEYATNAGGSWSITKVDEAGYVGWETSIALDSNDKVHISYYDYTGKALKYATNAGGSWATATVDTTDDTGRYTSIALDSNDKVHISYVDNTNKRIMYASNVGGSWGSWSVEVATGIDHYTSIAVDSSDKVHISYHRTSGTDSELRCFNDVAGYWSVEIVDGQNADVYTSIAIDSDGKAHIGYWDSTNRDLRYATNAIWYTETIDSTGNVGMGASMALDPSGNIHVSYQDATNKYLKYATNAMGHWTTTKVDASRDIGVYTSIAIDSAGKAHISYQDAVALDLRYATNAAGSWATTVVDSSNSVGDYSSIAVASDGDLYISYYDQTNRDLKCAYRSGTLWKHGPVDSYGTVGLYTSIALDSDDKAHISYYNASGGALKHATNAGGSWETMIVDDHDNLGWDTSIAIDSDDKVHISYYDVADSNLGYATNAAGGWSSTSPDHYLSTGYYSSIAISSEDEPHISYYDITNQCLKYVTKSGAYWRTDFVDRAGFTGGFTSLALDSNDKAHIVYYDYTNTALKYATNAPWRLQTIDMAGDAGRYSSIAIDSNDRFHISYFDEADNLRYINNVGGTWSMTVVDSGVNEVGKHTSIALDSNDKVYISYRDETAGRLRYATNAGGSWAIFSFLSDGVAGLYTSIAVDSNDKVHISHYDETHGDLKYTTNAGGTWTTVTADDGGTDDVGSWTSIAVDSNDKVHISYEDKTHYDLKYATNAGGSWDAAVIDDTVCGMYTSIAVDSDDKAHISYWGYTDRDLKYATNAGGAWTTYVADAGGDTGLMTSIALDSKDQAHVAYYDSTISRLRYASNAGGTWQKATLDINGAGGFPSIALDSSDKACISYFDFSKEDLKLAFESSEPSSPRNLDADHSPGSVTLQWSPPLSDHGFDKSAYRIYRGATPSTLKPLSTASGDLLTYTDGSLPAGTYYYAVAAVNAVGRGPLSNVLSVTMTPPGAPTGLTAAPGDALAVLNWTAPAEDGGFPIEHYKVYRGATPGGEAYLTTLGNVLTYTNTGLANGQTYFYRVSAVNDMGEGALSSEASATPFTLPSAPLGLTAMDGDSQIMLNWTAPSSDGGDAITGYNLYRGPAPGGEALLIGLGNVLSHTDTGLANGQTYFYRVSAVNGAGEGPWSDEASATPATVPSAPSGLTASTGDAHVLLNWTAPSYLGPGTITYHLFRDGTLVWSGEELEHNDSGLANGVTYSYTVAAQNSVGWGPNSTEVQATPLSADTVPTAPGGLTAVPGNQLVDLNWTEPSYLGPGTILYHLFRDGALIWSGSGLAYHDAPLVKNVQYSYSVAASNDLGWGPNSTSVLATSLGVPDAPWGLSATGGDGQASLSWSAPNYTGPGTLTYHLFRDGELVWSGEVVSHVEGGLANGWTYTYRVAASNSLGMGPSSSGASAFPQGPPTAPRGLYANAGNGLVTLNWTEPSYAGPAPVTYHLYRDGALLWSGSGLEYQDTGVANFVEYSYQVAAENPLGLGPNCTAALATPLPDEMEPNAPRNLVATAGDRKVTLSWVAPEHSNASAVLAYLVSYGTSPGSLTSILVGDEPSCVLEGLDKGRVHYFQVAARNAAGWGPNSTVAEATPFGVPSEPINLTAVRFAGYVQLSWEAPSYGGPGMRGYAVFRDGAQIGGGDALEYYDTSIQSGVSYVYEVAAWNDVGRGASASIYVAAPVPPGAPTGLRAVAGPGGIALDWTAPSDQGGTPLLGYNIFRGTNPGSLAYLGSANGTAYVDRNVTGGQTYFYRVCAFSSGAWGEWSEEAQAEAQGGPPPAVPLEQWQLMVLILAAALAVTLIGALVVRRMRTRAALMRLGYTNCPRCGSLVPPDASNCPKCSAHIRGPR